MFDAGAIQAHLDVDMEQFDRKLTTAEERVKRFEDKRHEVKIVPVLDSTVFGQARRAFAQFDQMITRDAMQRARGPQGSVFGSLSGLFNPKSTGGRVAGGLGGVSPLIGAGLASLPAVATLGGAGLGAAAGLGGLFATAGLAAAAFGAVAKPVLTSALTAEQAVQKAQTAYNAAIAGGTKQATAYAAEQKAISAAYAQMSPQQIALSRQLGAMSKAWEAIKKAETPVVAGALKPWLQSVTDLTRLLGPIIDRVSGVIGSLGSQFDALINSQAFVAFRNFIASTGSAALSATGNLLISFIQALVILLPKFNPLIQEAIGWLGNLGPSLDKWASSQKTADAITKFMAWFAQNGPVVGRFLESVGRALAALAPGLTAGGALELQVLTKFLDFVARMPKGIAGPLTEVAGAALILAKLPGGTKVITFAVNLVGAGIKWLLGIGEKTGTVTVAAGGMQRAGDTMVAAAAAMQKAADTLAAGVGINVAEGGAGAAGGAAGAGLWSKILPGVKLGTAGLLIATLVVDPILKAIPSGPGGKNWLDNPFGMPGPNDPKSANNWLTSWAPYERFLTKTIPGWFSTAAAGSVIAWKGLSGGVASVWDGMLGGAKIWGRNISGSVSGTWSGILGGAGIAWRSIAGNVSSHWSNMLGGARIWGGNIAGTFGSTWRTISGGASSSWRTISSNVVGAVAGMVRSVGSWVGSLPGTIRGDFASAGSWLVGAGRNVLGGLWNGLKSVWGSVQSWIGGIAGWIKQHKGPVSLDSTLLYPAGHGLMSGFLNGLKAGFGPVGSFVGGLASWVAGQVQGVGGRLLHGVANLVFGGGSGVSRWIPLVVQALKMEGLDTGLLPLVLRQIQSESGGNPNAINLTDINAQRGDPSRGLLQTIMGTFLRWHWPGTSMNIYDPLANIAAALNYASHGAGIGTGGGQLGSGHAYAKGGVINEPVIGFGTRSGERYTFGEAGAEVVTPAGRGGAGGPLVNVEHIGLPEGSSIAKALNELTFWVKVAQQQGFAHVLPGT